MDINFKMGLKHVLKNTLFNFGQKTSIGGLANFVAAETIGKKAYWLILFLLGVFLTLYGIVTVILSFLEYEVVTSTDMFYETSLKMPAISVCNLNR